MYNDQRPEERDRDEKNEKETEFCVFENANKQFICWNEWKTGLQIMNNLARAKKLERKTKKSKKSSQTIWDVKR